MKKEDVISVALGIAMLATAGIGLFLLIRWTVERISTLESQTSSAIIAGSVAILIAAMGHAFQATWNRRRQIEEAQGPAKTELYEELIDGWFHAMNLGRQKPFESLRAYQEGKYGESRSKIARKMLLWGSDEVILAHQLWWRVAQRPSTDSDHAELLARFEGVLLACRRDLGHKNRGLDRTHLLSLFINEIESLDLSNYPLKAAKSQRRKASQQSKDSSPSSTKPSSQ